MRHFLTTSQRTERQVPELLRKPSGYARYLGDTTLIQGATFAGFLDPVHQSDAANLTEATIILSAR